jgi:hypothetical protein
MTDNGLDRRIGIWHAVGEFKIKDAMWPEGLCALVIGVGGSALIIGATTPTGRSSAVGDVLILAGALLAVVFAALALVVSLPSPSYLRMLRDTPGGGMGRFLDPFLVAVGTQIAIILLAIAYQLAAASVVKWIEHAAFGLLGFLFIFGILDIAALARQLVRHGVLRAEDAALSHDEQSESQPVRRLPDRRG